jgi:hypothetical protein
MTLYYAGLNSYISAYIRTYMRVKWPTRDEAECECVQRLEGLHVGTFPEKGRRSGGRWG